MEMAVSTPEEKTPVNKYPFFSANSKCLWPSKEVPAGEPLFTSFLKDADLDALHEDAGLGPLGWWLDPQCGDGKLSSPTFEEDVALTAWAREPFERMGKIRDASRGLLDRLNELERLQNLVDERARSKPPLMNKVQKVEEKGGLSNVYHSNLSLASDRFTEEGVPLPNESGELPPISSLNRRDGFVAQNQPEYFNSNHNTSSKGPFTSSPKITRGQTFVRNAPLRSCVSPTRRDSVPPSGKAEPKLHRTYSKNSLQKLTYDSAVAHQNNSNAAEDNFDKQSLLSNKLGRTYDAEEVSDVFPSPRASLEDFSPSVPPVTPSANLPQPRARNLLLTYNANSRSGPLNTSSELNDLSRQQEASLRASASRYSVKGSNDSGLGLRNRIQRSDAIVPPAVRVAEDSPTRRPTLMKMPANSNNASNNMNIPTAEVRTSLPSMPTNFSATLDLAKQQEASLRASTDSGPRNPNNSLTNSLEGNSRENIYQFPATKDKNEDAIVGTYQRNVPLDGGIKPSHNTVSRRHGERMMSAHSAGNLATSMERKTSLSSQKRMGSDQLIDIARQQEQALRASTEQLLRRERSNNSLLQSIDSNRSVNFSDSASEDVGCLPPKPELSQSNPAISHNVSSNLASPSKMAQQLTSVHNSTDTYPIIETPPVRQSVSPKRVRKTSRTKPSPLTLPLDTETKLPSMRQHSPNAQTSLRPGSYTDQLQNPKNPGSAVDAWVSDTLAVVPNESLKLSTDSASVTVDCPGVGDSADTEAHVLTESMTLKPKVQPSRVVTTRVRPPTSASGSQQSKPQFVQVPLGLFNTSENSATEGGVQMRSKLRPPGAVPAMTLRSRIAPVAVRGRGRAPIATVTTSRGMPPRPSAPREPAQRPRVPVGLPTSTLPARTRPETERVPITRFPTSSGSRIVSGPSAASTGVARGGLSTTRGRTFHKPT